MSESSESDGGAIIEVPRPSSSAVVRDPRFKLMSVKDLLARPSAPWVVKRVLHCGEHAYLYSEPSVGKTFMAIDLGLKIAAGQPWWGYGVKQGPVVYVAAEGTGGLCKRVKAWALENNADLDPLPFYVLPHAVIFGDDEEFIQFYKAIAAMPELPVLIVIDTLARCMAGCDENSAEEMGAFVDRCAKLQALGPAVLVIHHKNKTGQAERGSTALRGAADVMWEATRLEDGSIKLVGSKAKETEPLSAIYLRTRSYMLGLDADGEIETSLALELGEHPQEPIASSMARPSHQSSAGGAEILEVDIAEQGVLIRDTMRTLYNGGPVAGKSLLEASGVKKADFYTALKLEIEAGRIRKDSDKRYPKYLLTELAPEFVPPTPDAVAATTDQASDPSTAKSSSSSSSSFQPDLENLANSNSNSRSEDHLAPAGSREFESEFGDIPKELPPNSNSRSAPDLDPLPKAKRTKAKKSPKLAVPGPVTADAAPPASASEPPDPSAAGEVPSSSTDVGRG